MDHIHQRALLSVMSYLGEKKRVQSLRDLDVSVRMCARVKEHLKNVLNTDCIFSDDKYCLSGG